MSAPGEGPRSECNPPRAKKTKQTKNKPIRRKDKRPILRGFRAGRMVYVHCPWCDRFHEHGWDLEDDTNVVTARVAHGAHGNIGHGAPDYYWISVFRENDLKEIELDREWVRVHEAGLKLREERLKTLHEAEGEK